jgi:heterodisulfide reductase subunit A
MTVGSVLVLGGGIAGIQASLDLAESGFLVYLVESFPTIGGTMARLDKTFPTNDCSMCILSPKMVDTARHKNIILLTNSEIKGLSGSSGDFKVKVLKKPTYVDFAKCTGCGACALACIQKDRIPNEFDTGLAKRGSAYIPFPQAIPAKYLIDSEHCVYLTKGKCGKAPACKEACTIGAIDFTQKPEEIELHVGSIILAPGLEVFDATLKPEYGYGVYPNVVTSLEFERILSSSGPFGGVVKRPSNGATPESIAFIQCVGSRDQASGNTYCSSVCCMYAIKEAVIAQEHTPRLKTHIFFMDVRAFGKEFEDYRIKAEKEYGVKITRNNKVASIVEIPETRRLLISYIDGAEIKEEEFDMVVLSVGLRPTKDARHLSGVLGMRLNKHNFCETELFSPVRTSVDGICTSGVFASPKDIPDTVAQASASAAVASSRISSERGKLVTAKEYPPEMDVAGQEPRVGVFVCRCGVNISSVVDVPKVVEYAKTLPNVVHAEESMYACSQDSQKKIKESIKNLNLNRIVIASCTPRTHERMFQETISEVGLNPYLFEMANIREHCSWVHMHEPEDATEKAKDLVRMVVAKARLLEPLRKSSLPITRKALVIGGGLCGMTAALEIASHGFEVHLLEKEKELGGNMKNIHYTLGCDDVQARLAGLIDAVRKNEKIHVYTSASIKNVEGYVGNFKTTFLHSGETKTVEHGVVIVAVGAKQYHPTEYMYGKDPRVLTTLEFEGKLMKEGTKAKSIVMVQCVGSRDENWPNCSRVCCSNAIANALKVKEKSPETNIYILYKDIHTYGFREDYYTEAARRGVTFIRYYDEHTPVVGVDPNNGKLEVRVLDAFIDEEILLTPDLFIISAGTRPNEDNAILAQMLKVPLSKDGFFLEAHTKLRPLDFATDGVFLCGLAHAPKFIDENISQALGAAARAITILSKDSLEGEAVIAVVDEELCRGCGKCEEICEFKAPKLIEKGGRLVSQINEALCKGCGKCSVVCCNKSISMRHFKAEQLNAMIEAALEGAGT